MLAASFALWLIVAVAGPYLFIGSSLAETVVGIAVAAPFGAALVTGAAFRALNAETAAITAAFVIPASLSTALGSADFLTVFAIAVLPIYVLASAAMLEVPPEAMRRALRVVAVATLVTLVAATFAAHEERFFTGQFAAWERLSGGRHANYVGLTALVGMLAALAWKGVVRIGLFVAFVWITYLAQSRMTLICMLICIAALGFEAFPRLLAFRKSAPRVFPVVLAGGLAASGGAVFLIVRKLMALSSLGGRDVSEMGGRSRIWSLAVDVYAQAPLLGYGYRSQYTLNLLGGYYSHNMWLSSLIEIGAFGTLIFLAVYVFALVVATRNARRDPVARFCLVTLLVYLVYGIAEGRYINTGNPLSVLFLFAVAWCFALHHRNRTARAGAPLFGPRMPFKTLRPRAGQARV